MAFGPTTTHLSSPRRWPSVFEPGEVRSVDSPHYMEPEIPGEIATAVRDAIALGASTTTQPTAPPPATTTST